MFRESAQQLLTAKGVSGTAKSLAACRENRTSFRASGTQVSGEKTVLGDIGSVFNDGSLDSELELHCFDAPAVDLARNRTPTSNSLCASSGEPDSDWQPVARAMGANNRSGIRLRTSLRSATSYLQQQSEV
jgi:hypothetical protein